jgi:hypothetical protein
MPVKAAVAEPNWTLHQGVDIAAAGHTPLFAVGDGTIIGHGIQGFGPSAPILKLSTPPSSAPTPYVYYGHAGPANMVADGTQVKAGQTISEVGAGDVGISNGPHLEIGWCEATGNPVGPSTAGNMKQDLIAASALGLTPLAAATLSVSEQAAALTGGGALTPAQAATAGQQLQTGLNQINQNTLEQLVEKGVLAVLGDFWDLIKGSAVYAGLFVLCVFGGAVLVSRGLRGSVEGRPSPEPAS